MAEDSGAILRHISSLKDMLDKVNEEIEQNIERTREIESEIVKHSETEKDYIDKESVLLKEVSVAEFELNGLIQVAAAETDLLNVIEGNLKFQKVALNGIRKTLSDKINLLGESLEREVTVNLAELKRPNLDLTELDASFAEEEVWKTINSLPSCKALGPDSFNGKFYRVYWQIIKVNVMAAISAVWGQEVC
ncbi:uncharacterized protein LOC120665941 isoform X4 [Panicum virgatum]|uniref:uncharacterized protein LOC120665941 isoform X4 n=1 Tax=Panicum virgatum TaxID=38727 RepID=UPI0019D6A6BE|nr:uncharacterized protein LOC120665941 isoform X4 [Panicum virgatum]